MTRFILRTALTTLALVLLFAGSFNLTRTGAVAVEPAKSKCEELTGCTGGPTLCGAIHLPDGTVVECGMR